MPPGSCHGVDKRVRQLVLGNAAPKMKPQQEGTVWQAKTNAGQEALLLVSRNREDRTRDRGMLTSLACVAPATRITLTRSLRIQFRHFCGHEDSLNRLAVYESH